MVEQFEHDSEPPPFRLRPGDQPLPVEVPGVRGSHDLVIEDLVRLYPSADESRAVMHGRARIGLERYGQLLCPGNSRSSRRDSTEEAADLVVYLKNMIREGERVEHHYRAALTVFVGLVEGR